MANTSCRPCPVCEFGENLLISPLCGNLKILGLHFPDSSSNNVICQNCGAVYVDMNSSQADFDLYYGSIAKPLNYTELFGAEEVSQYFNEIYSTIEPFIDEESHILDLGCGSGEFSKLLVARGHKHVVAADLSQACVDIVRKAGISAFLFNAATRDGTPECRNGFDLIVYSHTLEHIYDAAESMRNVKRLLKDDGVLFIEVPDAEKYESVDLGPYFFFTYEHLMHLTSETLQNYSSIIGLDLLQTKTYLKCNRYYVVSAIFRNGGSFSPLIREVKAAASVAKYEELCRQNIKDAIQPLKSSEENLILWGVGSSTAQLLVGHFEGCNVVKLVDSNTTRQGIQFKINNRILAIEAPNTIEDESAMIVILSFMFRDSIIRQIRESGFANKLATLTISK